MNRAVKKCIVQYEDKYKYKYKYKDKYEDEDKYKYKGTERRLTRVSAFVQTCRSPLLSSP